MSEHRFLRACHREPVDCTPVWIMRQAGRYLPEYQAMRARHSMLDICRTPDLARQVTMQPLDRFDLDAAILFSDLLVPLGAVGVDFDIVEGTGPVVERPCRTVDDIRGLSSPDLDRVGYVFEAVKVIQRELARRERPIPLIGFSGAPFTVASYLVEGGPTRTFRETKLLMYREPQAWNDLLALLSDLLAGYLERQIEAGADAVQVFDSWVGCLSPAEYRAHVMEPTRRVLEAGRRRGVPVIHFGTMNAHLLDLMTEAGGDVIGVDHRLPLELVRRRCPDKAVQGNLDPLALMAPREVLERKIRDVLESAGSAPGHVFNLGHGIMPGTPIDSVRFLVEKVHEMTRP